MRATSSGSILWATAIQVFDANSGKGYTVFGDDELAGTRSDYRMLHVPINDDSELLSLLDRIVVLRGRLSYFMHHLRFELSSKQHQGGLYRPAWLGV